MDNKYWGPEFWKIIMEKTEESEGSSPCQEVIAMPASSSSSDSELSYPYKIVNAKPASSSSSSSSSESEMSPLEDTNFNKTNGMNIEFGEPITSKKGTTYVPIIMKIPESAKIGLKRSPGMYFHEEDDSEVLNVKSMMQLTGGDTIYAKKIETPEGQKVGIVKPLVKPIEPVKQPKKYEISFDISKALDEEEVEQFVEFCDNFSKKVEQSLDYDVDMMKNDDIENIEIDL